MGWIAVTFGTDIRGPLRIIFILTLGDVCFFVAWIAKMVNRVNVLPAKHQRASSKCALVTKLLA